MPIKIKCRCGKGLKVRDNMAGKRVRCPDCGQPVAVPEPEYEAYDEPDYNESHEVDPYAAPPPKRRKKSPPQKTSSSGSPPIALIVGGVLVAALICGGIMFAVFGRGGAAIGAAIVDATDTGVAKPDSASVKPAAEESATVASTQAPSSETSPSNSEPVDQTAPAETAPAAEMPQQSGNIRSTGPEEPPKVWVVLSDFKEQSNPNSIGKTYQVNYRIVSGQPDPSRQYIIYIGTSMGMMERYNEVPVSLESNGTVHIPAGIGMTGKVSAYVAWKKGRQDWAPVSGRIEIGGEATAAQRPPTVVEAAGADAQGKLIALANARFEKDRTGRNALLVDYVLQNPLDLSKRCILVVTGNGTPIQTDVSFQLQRTQPGEKGRMGVSVMPGQGFPDGNLKVHIELRKSRIDRGEKEIVSNTASVRR